MMITNDDSRNSQVASYPCSKYQQAKYQQVQYKQTVRPKGFTSRKTVSFLTLGLCVFAQTTFCSTAQARTWAQIQQSGELRVGVTANYSPMAFRNKLDKLVGYDIDMTKSLAKSLGLKVSYVDTTWKTIESDFNADKFDIAAGGVTKTVEREKDFLLSSSVAKNGKVILANCSRKLGFARLEQVDQPNVKIVVDSGSSNERYAYSHIKKAKVYRQKSHSYALKLLKYNVADVMFLDLIEGRHYQNSYKGTLCVASPVLEGTLNYKVYMMKKADKELLAKVNNWIANGSNMQIARQWMVVR
ncbi:MAG: transporter substrate-binding domain-containing protein [Vibrio sp.]